MFYKKWSQNDNDNNFYEMLNDGNYNKIINKSHDAGWENSYLKSTVVFMLGGGCGVSQY